MKILEQKTFVSPMADNAELYYWLGTLNLLKGEANLAVEQLEKGLLLADRQGNKELINQIKEQLAQCNRRMGE